MERNMEYILKDGRTLYIKGKKFGVEIAKNAIILEVLDNDNKFIVDPKGHQLDFTANEIAISKEPSPVVSYNDIIKNDKIKNDEIFFKDFISAWEVNWRIENTDQPDRVKLLTDTMNYNSGSIFRYIKHYGGLTHAIINLNKLDKNNKEDRLYARLLAENIAQVGSIVCPPLSELLEYPFKI